MSDNCNFQGQAVASLWKTLILFGVDKMLLDEGQQLT